MTRETVNDTLNKMFSLENKVILMTGAAGEIGSEIAKCYANLGAKVVIADFNETAMEAVKGEIREAGGECLTLKLNRRLKNTDGLTYWPTLPVSINGP